MNILRIKTLKNKKKLKFILLRILLTLLQELCSDNTYYRNIKRILYNQKNKKMKKILIAALALFIVNGAIAQSIRGGIKVGSNLSTLTNTVILGGGIAANGKMKFGFHTGGFVDFAFSERVSLQPELLYSAQGAKYAETFYDRIKEENMSMTALIAINYINIPVLLKINIADGLSAEIGPQIGFLISAEQDIKFNNIPVWSERIKGTNTLDITAITGLSYAFSGNFVVSARYGLGLTYVNKDSVFPQKNSVIQLGVGYKF